MTDYLRVCNFEQLQHYKDRDPPWIKLYFRMLDDYAFAKLPDAAKWHLVGVFLLASRCGNKIAADAKWVGRKIGASTAVDLAALEQAGFLERMTAEALAACEQPAGPETETETETETEKISLSAGADPSKIFAGDFEEFWSRYPIDPLMSKKKAGEQWARLGTDERQRALEALPQFKDFVSRQKDYRVVHAWKFLSERRFDGFEKPHIAAEAIAAAKDRADRLMKRGKYAERYG